MITRSALADASLFGISSIPTNEFTLNADSFSVSTNAIMTPPPASTLNKQKMDLMRPMYTVTHFDGSDPKRVINVIKETEDYVKKLSKAAEDKKVVSLRQYGSSTSRLWKKYEF